MTLAITATVTDEAGDNPHVHLVVTGTTGDSILIERIDPLAVRADVPVRGGDNVPLVSFPGTAEDYEVPLTYGYQYRARTYLAGVLQETATSSTVTVDPAAHGFYHYFFIKNVSDPSTSRRVMVASFDENSFEPAILGTYKILGRKKPIVYTDEWGARQGGFELLAGDYNSDIFPLNEVATLLKTGDVLLFQTAVQGDVIEDMYFIVTSLTQQQYTTMSANEYLDFTLSVGFQEVDRPITSGQQQGIGTWGDLKDDVSMTTWQDVLNNNATWTEVLNNYSS